MNTLYLVRHGETEWNHTRRYLGHTDIPLNETGKKQAAALSRQMDIKTVDLILASDLKRTFETASILNQVLKTDLKPEPRLREIFFGDMEGIKSEEAHTTYADEFKKWLDDPECPLPGGESLSDLGIRLSSLLDELKQDKDLDTVMLVTHSGVLRMLIRLLLQLPEKMQWHFRFDLTSLSEIEFRDAFPVIQYLNDTHHLNGK